MSNRSFVSVVPALARLLALVCGLLGLGAVMRMDVVPFPDRPVPVYTIHLAAPGLTAAKVDETVARPVEESVRAIGEALTITSTSRAGAASVTVETTERIGASYKERLEKKLGEVTKQLPVKEWSISQDNLADNRVGQYLLHGSDVQTLADTARYTIYEKLIRLPGVARVEIDDRSVKRQVDLIFRPPLLLAYGLTPGDILAQLPGDVAGEQLGSVGENKDQATFYWTSLTEGPQGLGKQLIATDKGSVTLKTLADIRDLRGSKGDEVGVYRGSPAIGITVWAGDASQVPAVRKQAAEAVAELNEAADGKYRIDLFADSAQPLVEAIGQLSLLAALAAAACALFLYGSQKRIGAALLSLLAVVMADGFVLGGMWLAGLPLTYPALGPVIALSLFFTGAGAALSHRLLRLSTISVRSCLQEAWKLMKPLLLALAVVAAAWAVVMTTDLLKGEDRIVLWDAGPPLLFGAVGLLLVYGFIAPVLTGTWLGEAASGESVPLRRAGKAAAYAAKRWERLVKQGYLPYGATLTASLLLIVLLHSFVLTDPYGKLSVHDKTLNLEMVQGSSIDDAMRAAQIAEERLGQLAEVRDVYTVASRERLTMHLQLADKDDWTITLSDLEKELDKRLRDIPGTDPFAFVVRDDMQTRLEFTVKGPSRQTAQAIAQEVLTQLQKYTARDEDGQEIITDERIGSGTERTIIDIRPKPDMLARYRVTEAQIRSQLEDYLGEKNAGSVYWNDESIAVKARFPDKWMDYPEQVRTIWIRTPQGKVHLGALVHWQIGQEPPVYEREDGQYVFTVSSAVRDAGRIDSLSYVLPLRMQKAMIVPEGYQILNADELKKLQEEQAGKTDWSGRVFAIGGWIAAVVLASLLLQRRARDGIFALALLPVLAGGVMLGLLVMDRPLNGMAVFGMAGALALLLQQALVALDDLHGAGSGELSVWEGVRTGFARSLASLTSSLASAALASVPLAFGWLAGADAFASFACTLLFGTVLAAFAAGVLIPAMYYAAERKQRAQGELTLPVVMQRIRAWWENERVRKQDARERKQRLLDRKREQQAEHKGSAPPAGKELSGDDFLPLSMRASDTNR